WARDTTGQSLSAGLNFGPETWTMADRNALSTESLRSLAQGGGRAMKVEAIIIKGCEKFRANKRRWYKATFRQRIPKESDHQKLFWQRYTSNDVWISAKKPREGTDER